MNLANKKVATLTLGCKVNQYETDAMRELLEQEGCELVDFGSQADIYIVNTCSVTNMAERKSRQMLHKAKKMSPDSIVVAVGCYVQTVPQEVMDDLAVDIVVGNNCKKNIVPILHAYDSGVDARIRDEAGGTYTNSKLDNASWIPIDRTDEYEALRVSHMQEHTRAYIKIQDGCNQFCSYCIIPYVRGRIRSRDIESVLSEIKVLAAKGCKEVVLTGIHLSSYGKDWNQEYSKSSELRGDELLTLMKQIDEIDGIERIRLGSLEPRIISEDFVAGLQEVSKLCPHFHLSLQSACNETLRRMNRKYTIEEYMEGCRRLREVFDRPAITTDVIVGFPGETEEEFQTTLKNLEVLNLYEIHVFKYSKRRGTVAEGMPGQVSEQDKNQRSDRLLALTSEQKKAYEHSFDGEDVTVLVEESVAEGVYTGHTERYIQVEVPSEQDIVNQMMTVKYRA